MDWNSLKLWSSATLEDNDTNKSSRFRRIDHTIYIQQLNSYILFTTTWNNSKVGVCYNDRILPYKWLNIIPIGREQKFDICNFCNQLERCIISRFKKKRKKNLNAHYELNLSHEPSVVINYLQYKGNESYTPIFYLWLGVAIHI